MKNLLNLGKELSKVEQKKVLGGEFGDTGLPEVGPQGPCTTFGVGSVSCQCYLSGGSWNVECGRCDYGAYFAVGCDQVPLNGGAKQLGGL